MDGLNVLIAIGLIHCSLFFFDTIFKTCSHNPYFFFLKNTGLEVQIFRIKWFTTAFNRKIIKWGMDCSKFWTTWFNAGLIISLSLLPVALFIIIYNIWTNLQTDSNNAQPLLEPMLPGIDIPFNEIGYYSVALAVCVIVHELGHALAASRECLQIYGLELVIIFIVATASVHINDEQLKLLPTKNKLRVVCAGIWHNIVLTLITATIFLLSTWIWAPLYSLNKGVYVTTILPNSPVKGPSGLLENDIIHKINDCPVRNTDDWYNCILHTVNHPTPGYCVKHSFMQNYDQSVLIGQKSNGIVNCCTADNEESGNLCFERLKEDTDAGVHFPPYMCLPVRNLIKQSEKLCYSSHECFSQDTYCMKPALDNTTKIVQIQREIGKDVLFFGHPAEIYRTVDISDWVPKYSLFHPNLPDTSTLFCKYVTIFSAGLAIINVLPCYAFDGAYIIEILINSLFKLSPHNKHFRQTIIFTVKCISTLLLTLNVIYVLINKLL